MLDPDSNDYDIFDIPPDYVEQPDLIIRSDEGGIMSSVTNFIKGIGGTILGAIGVYLGWKSDKEKYPTQTGISYTALIIFLIALVVIFLIAKK